MKGTAPIGINFASRDYRLLAKILWSLIAGSLVLLAALVVMARVSVSSHAHAALLDRGLAKLTARDNEIKVVLLEREQLLKDISTMSPLMEARRFSWTRLLTGIEAAFPTGVALERVAFNPKDSTLSLEGKAASPEALRNLMVGLEKSASFKDPLLKHQSIDKGVISFAVGTKYHEAKGAGLAQEK